MTRTAIIPGQPDMYYSNNSVFTGSLDCLAGATDWDRGRDAIWICNITADLVCYSCRMRILATVSSRVGD